MRSSIDPSQSRQGDKMRSRRAVPTLLAAFVILTTGFGIYLRVLYRQLDQAFEHSEEFIPTRVYSDVTRIAAPQPKTYVEGRLKALGYSSQAGATPSSLAITLH